MSQSKESDKATSNKMGVMQLTILTIVNMMGSGIIMLPTKLAEVGTISILSWLVTAVGSTALAYAFAKCGMFSKKKGGMGGYAEYAFGKSGNFLSNYTYASSLLIANIAIAISAVGYGVEMFNMGGMDLTLGPIGVCMAVIGLLAVTTFANFGGPKVTGQIGAVTVWGVIIPVVGISIIGWFWFSPTMWLEAWNPHALPVLEAAGASVAMTLWAFLGLESACANMDAVENPEKNVPIAVLGGTIGAAIIYIVSTNVVAGIIPNPELALSNAPFGLVFASIFNPTIGFIVTALAVLACVGSLLGWQFTVAQVFKGSADEGFFPKIFSEVSKAGAPIKGMLILLGVQCLLALMTISPSLSEQFEVLVNLAVITNIVPYILAMAGLMIMQKIAGVEASKAKINNAIATLGAVFSMYALYSAGEQAMMFGALMTFFGWIIYGFMAHKFEKNSH